MKKILPWILFSLTLVASLYFFMLLLNAGSAIDDARRSESRQKAQNELALKILRNDWIGRTNSQVSRLASEFRALGHVVKSEVDAYEIDGIIFETKNGIVTNVRLM